MPVMRRGATSGRALPPMRRLAARRTWPAPPASSTSRTASRTALRLLAAGLVGGLFWPGPAVAGTSGPNGTLKGTVIDGSGGDPRPGVQVTLISVRRDGSERTTEKVVTDRSGRFRFKDLTPGGGRVYSVQAEFDGGLFAGAPIQIPGGTEAPPVIDSTLRVWRTTSDPAAILVKRDAIFLAPSDDGLGVIESVVVENTSPRAYIGRGASMAEDGRPASGGTPTLGFSLPSGADGSSVVLVDASWEGPAPVATDFGFGATVAIPPGESSTTFSYRLTGSGGLFDASRTALYPTSELVVHAVQPLEVEGNRLAADGSVRVAGRTYRRWSTAEGIEAGDIVQVAATAQAGLDVPLLAGLAAGVALFVAAGAFAYTRRRRTRPALLPTRVTQASSPPSPARPAASSSTAPSREEVIATIAGLDLDHDSGRLSDEEWRGRRGALKELLGESTSERTR